MTKRTGVQTRLNLSSPLRNRSVENDYYQQRAAEATSRAHKRKVDRRKVVPERLQGIADDLRTMTVAEVMQKWRAGRETVLNVDADRLMGKYHPKEKALN